MLRPDLALWSVFPVLMLHSGGLVVDTPSPDAFCPALEQTRQVVEARLGAVELDGTWKASYVLAHRTSGDFVVLTLRDPRGRIRLERSLPVEAGSCSTLSQVIALVLERFFTTPDANRQKGDPVDGTAPLPDAGAPLPDAGAPLPDAGASLRDESSRAPVTPPLEPRPASVIAPSQPKVATVPKKVQTRERHVPRVGRWQLGAGLSVSPEWFATVMSVATGLGAGFAVDLRLGLDLLDHELDVGDGAAKTLRFPVGLELLRRVLARDTLRLDVGGGLLGWVERGSTQGLLQSGAEVRVVPGLAGTLQGVFLKESDRIAPYVRGTLGVTFRELAPAFEIDGRGYFEPSRWLVGGELGLRMRI